jgi:hypothetical protein
MMSALPMTADKGTPPAMLLATVMRSGSTPECSIGKQLARAREAGLNFVGDEQDAVPVTERAQAAEEFWRRDVEPAFALHWLDDDRRDARRIDISLEQLVNGRRMNLRR